MKALTVLFAAITALVGISAQAASKAEVWDLVRRIDSELRFYEQSPETLEFARIQLEEALNALRGGPINDPQACTDFAFAEYVKDGFSNSSALQKAKTFCTRATELGVTLEVVRFFYVEIKKDGFSATTALQHSLDLGQRVRPGGLACVRTAFERYSRDGFSRRTSLQKAVEFCEA